MINYSDIVTFVSEKTHEKEIEPGTDIFNELSCTGDDFHELIEGYQKRFSVDMSDYLWYFHANEEGQNIGKLFFKPPYERVKRIPVTPQMLYEFAERGKWSLPYPSHKLPKYRIDIWIVWVLITIVLFFLIRSCLI